MKNMMSKTKHKCEGVKSKVLRMHSNLRDHQLKNIPA